MRKLIVLALTVAVVGLWAGVARAESGSELEISGNVTTVSGWQLQNSGGSARQPNVRGGLLGDNLAALGVNGNSTFGFFVDQVETDLAKNFGENIRVRADLDFSPAAGTGRAPLFGGGGDFLVEQAYATANIPAGNGVELLVGRFNSGIGLDPIDRNELKTVSFSMAHRVILPHNLTGARLGYDFNESTRGELFLVNNLGDFGATAGSVLPSGGFNVIYNWGQEGAKNWAKLSGALGAEHAAVSGNKDITFLGDVSANWTATDALAVGIEGYYRQDDKVAQPRAAKFFGGTLSATYGFSDVWDGTLRYGYLLDVNGNDGAVSTVVGTNEGVGVPGLATVGGAASGQKANHELALATGYAITEGARFALEGRVDLAQSAGGASMGFAYGLGGMFAYSF